MPRTMVAIGTSEHSVLRFGVVNPTRSSLQIGRAELPTLARVRQTLLKTALLLLVRNRQPILYERDPFVLQRLLELRTKAQELLVLLGGAIAHHMLNARPVVPATVEQSDLSGGRQMSCVTREVPLGALALVGSGQGHD